MGRGIVAQDDLGGTPSRLEVRTTLVAENRETSILVLGADATLDTVVVRDTKAQVKDGKSGLGVVVARGDGTGTPSKLSLRRCLVERSLMGGVYLEGSEGTIEATTVRDTLGQTDGRFGRGISAQADREGTLAKLLLRDASVLRSCEAGVAIVGSAATLEHIFVEGTIARIADGTFGDGIVVQGAMGDGFHLVSSRVSGSARASLSVFGGSASVASSMMTCAAFDIDIEPLADLAPAIDDLGGNICGCEAVATCRGLSSNLAPMDPLPQPPSR